MRALGSPWTTGFFYPFSPEMFGHCSMWGNRARITDDSAGVMELAVMHDSKSCGVTPVRVRLPPPAPDETSLSS